MLLEVGKTDFLDIVSACMLNSKSKLESLCLLVLFTSTCSHTPGVNSLSKNSFSIPNSGMFMIS